jgi:cytochrome c-type biogenesis protein CcmH
MTLFLVIAVAMAAVALAWVLPVLLRRRDMAVVVQTRASNLAILKDQLAELEQDVAAGTLPQAQYQQAREDLERRAYEEAREPVAPVAVAPAPARRTAIVLAALLPICAAALYWQFGTPEGLVPAAEVHGGSKVTSQEVEAMVAKLAARMQQSPDDGNGWALLARSYLVMQRHADAVAAYERAVALIKDDADLLADYADALAMTQGRRIEGKPLKVVERALKIDPLQWKALAMAGSAAFERKDFKTAVAYWEKLQSRAEPGSDFAREVAANVDEARQLGGLKVAASDAPPVKADAKSTGDSAGASVEGTVALSRELAGKAAPTDTVFVFARAAEGPRMPLAIMRFQVKDLPAKFHLDDSMAMSPAAKLSNHPNVIIGARVSKSANATPQPGDLQGASKPVKAGATGVTVIIDQLVP